MIQGAFSEFKGDLFGSHSLAVVIWIIDAGMSGLFSKWLMACVPKSFSSAVIPPSALPSLRPLYIKDFHSSLCSLSRPAVSPCLWLCPFCPFLHFYNYGIENGYFSLLSLFPASPVVTTSPHLPISPSLVICHFPDIFRLIHVPDRLNTKACLVVVNINSALPFIIGIGTYYP